MRACQASHKGADTGANKNISAKKNQALATKGDIRPMQTIDETNLKPTQIINVSKLIDHAPHKDQERNRPAASNNKRKKQPSREGAHGNSHDPCPTSRPQGSKKSGSNANSNGGLTNSNNASAKPTKPMFRNGSSTVPIEDQPREHAHSASNTTASENAALSSENGKGSNNDNQTSRGGEKYRPKKCLIVHSGVFKDFQADCFSREFDISLFEAKWTKSLVKEKLIRLIGDTQPECIFIHMGAHEVHQRERKQDILSPLEDFLWHLIDTTQARICVSTVIPTANNKSLNETIKELNDDIRDLVTELRRARPDLDEYLFSYYNDSVGWQNKEHHLGFELTEFGQKIMWKRLKDGLCKTLRIHRPHFRKSSSNENSKNHE